MALLATIASFGFEDLNPVRLLPLYRRLGCRMGQYHRNEHVIVDPQQARRLARDAGLTFDSIHGVFGREYDPSSTDEAIRRRAVQAYTREAELALSLEAPRVVVHPAPLNAPVDMPDAERQRRVPPLRRSIQELAEIGTRTGVTFLFENLPPQGWIGHDPAALAQMIRETSSEHLRMCFDTGHANLTGDVASQLRDCLDVVGYLHIHDNNGRIDSHLFPGHGIIQWDSLTPLLASLPADTPAMLELFYSTYPLHTEIEDGLGERLHAWLALTDGSRLDPA